MKKKIIETYSTQCDKCGLIGDRNKYSDGTYTIKCPQCLKKTSFKIIR